MNVEEEFLKKEIGDILGVNKLREKDLRESSDLLSHNEDALSILKKRQEILIEEILFF
jgi:hypothetical protein